MHKVFGDLLKPTSRVTAVVVLLICVAGAEIGPGEEKSEVFRPVQQQAPAKPGPAAAGPRIEFATNIHDFGKVVGGESVRFDFLFTNVGDESLQINRVLTSCGCTTAGEWDRTVEPGQKGKIPIEFNTGRFKGEIKKSIKVLTNAPGQEQVTIWLKATIWQPVEITPPYVAFGSIMDRTQPQEKTVKIVSHFEDPLEIRKIETTNPTFQAELKTIKPGKEFKLVVRAVPPFKNGSQWSTITLETSSPAKPKITINASGYAAPRVQFTPSRLLLHPYPLERDTERSIFVIHNATAPLKILDVTVNVDSVATRLIEMKPGKQFRITVKFPAGFSVKKDDGAKLSFKTDDPISPKVDIPILPAPPRPSMMRSRHVGSSQRSGPPR